MRHLRPCLALLVFVIGSLSTSAAFAGGSISFEADGAPLLRTQPALLQFVQQTLDVSPTGSGVRLGKQFGDHIGHRITPFEFEARPKGTTGPFTLRLIIHSPEGINNNDATTVTLEIKPLTDPTKR